MRFVRRAILPVPFISLHILEVQNINTIAGMHFFFRSDYGTSNLINNLI